MADRDLSGKPHHITEDVWFYEQPAGICIVHDIKQTGIHLRTEQFTIPWRSVRAALKRKDKAEPK